jgi:hypothetical protein
MTNHFGLEKPFNLFQGGEVSAGNPLKLEK